jgi:hypothetical protein
MQFFAIENEGLIFRENGETLKKESRKADSSAFE